MTKPVFYTRGQYYRACEEQRVLERNEQRKREERARGSHWTDVYDNSDGSAKGGW